MLSGDNTGDSQVHDVCSEHTEDLSTNNDSLFLTRSVSNVDCAKAKGIIPDASNFFQERLQLLLEFEIAARDANIGYSYDGEVVGSRDVASISGGTFINDKNLNVMRLLINNRNKNLLKSKGLEYKCYIDGHQIKQQKLLGLCDDDIPFGSSCCMMQHIEDLKSWPCKWSFNMMGKSFAQDEYPS
eukprot:10830224-Ditylum_brightwellii.AAC.1